MCYQMCMMTDEAKARKLAKVRCGPLPLSRQEPGLTRQEGSQTSRTDTREAVYRATRKLGFDSVSGVTVTELRLLESLAVM